MPAVCIFGSDGYSSSRSYPPRDLVESTASELAASLPLPAPGGLLRTEGEPSRAVVSRSGGDRVERRCRWAWRGDSEGLSCQPAPSGHRSRAIHRTGPERLGAGLPSLPSSPSTSRRRPGFEPRSDLLRQVPEAVGPGPYWPFGSSGGGGYVSDCSKPPRDLAGSSASESLSVAALGPRGSLRSEGGAELSGGLRAGGDRVERR